MKDWPLIFTVLGFLTLGYYIGCVDTRDSYEYYECGVVE